MNQEELISVIVPVYNVADYLPRCMETVLGQTYKNLEIILVDDGSTDKSGEMCDAYAKQDGRCKVIHQTNQGLYAARNSGKRVAKGKFLLFTDSDDYMHIEAIEELYGAITSGPGYEMSIMDRKITKHLNEDVTCKGEKSEKTELKPEELVYNMFRHPDETLFIYAWNKLYRRSLIDDFWFNEYLRSEDFDFNFRVYQKIKNAIWVHRVLYYYLQRPGSLCHTSDQWKLFFESQIDSLYKNFITLPKGKIKYRHLILEDLFPLMFQFLTNRWNTEERDLTCQKCLQYESSVRRDFWKDRDFSLITKVKWTLRLQLVRFPWFFDEVNKIRLKLGIGR
jgi:glycosyltransferase involved in cell wall biosynthesis